MGQGTCTRCGRDRKLVARGLCDSCYRMMRRDGSLEVIRPLVRRDFDAWLASMVGTPGCWIWPGTKDSGGYGMIHRNGRSEKTHRVAYELLVGPIPAGLNLDHLCHTWAVELGECNGGPLCPHRPCANALEHP